MPIEFEFTMANNKRPTRMRIFGLTFAIVFILTALLHFGLRVPKLVSPLPSRTDILEGLRPKLLEKPNTYKLRKPTVFIPTTYAASDADNATSYAVVDFSTGEVLAEKNLSEKLPIASLTKIMSAVVALDLLKPDTICTVPQSATYIIPTKIAVLPGEKLTLTELLHASLMTSANDAVDVIRDCVDSFYKEPLFVRAMNEKANIIGLNDSHFANPQGFDNPNNYSSAEDLAVLSWYALNKYPLIADIVKKDYTELFANKTHRTFDLYNWNGLLDVYPNVSGVKIGNTHAAGKTTVVLSERSGKKILAVLLGAPDVLSRDLWTAQLLDLGFEESMGLEPVNVTQWQLREKYATWQ